MKAGIRALDLSKEYFFDEGCFITELSNSATDPEVSIARARLEPGKITRWHYLKDTSERYVIVDGTGMVELADLPAQKLGPGDVVLIPPGDRQRIKNTGTVDLIFLAICSPRFVESAYVDIENDADQ